MHIHRNIRKSAAVYERNRSVMMVMKWNQVVDAAQCRLGQGHNMMAVISIACKREVPAVVLWHGPNR